jgi:NADH-quinone oxidoreductase subunit L
MGNVPAIFRWLWLEPAIPFASALALLVAGRALGKRAVAWLGTGSIAASLVIAVLVALGYAGAGGRGFTLPVWRWFAVAGLAPRIALYLDPLAIVMTLVVAFVSLLIHIYSTEFMARSEGYARFFGYMNLFVASMLTLTLAANLLMLLLGWEGVGLCSYLLIGFWYQDEANGHAGQKAFIVTRVGDTALIVGLFLLFTHLGTLNIQQLMQRAAAHWAPGAPLAEAAAWLLLGGALGKSAQLPLQTWLPDAMAGPTPTSALIHAATMVTAGVYLIARTHVLFALAPVAMHAVAGLGLATLLLAGCSALAQHDIKRILAYSTISQIGYMFLALGVGAWAAAIFHLVTHAFFKALLFLAAGAVIQAMHDEHDIFKMGGLRRWIPVTYWTFLIAGSSLAGLPLITAGFYSKGLILWSAYSSPVGSVWLWIGGLIGALLTALYIFRLIFIAFFGAYRGPGLEPPGLMPGGRETWPMIILGFLSIAAGLIDLPPALGGGAWLGRFLQPVLPPLAAAHAAGLGELATEAIAAAVFFGGVYLIWLFALGRPSLNEGLMAAAFPRALQRFWYSDWGMDWLYGHALVGPIVAGARAARHDPVDWIFRGIGRGAEWLNHGLIFWESGRVRRYASWIAVGAIVLAALAVLR